MGLFGPPNVEKMKAKRDVEGLIKALGYQKDASVRQAAAGALGQMRDPRAVQPLIAALKDSDRHVPETAAEALVKIGTPAVEPLIVALKDSDSNVRRLAAGALGQIGDARAVEPLIAARTDSNWELRQAAARALEQIGDARAVEPLVAALKASKGFVRHAAAGALAKIGDARSFEPLVAALKDSNEFVRKEAAEGLAKIGDARAVEPLIATLKDSYRWVRKAAAGALGQIADARAVEPLIAALKDSDEGVRMEAAEALDKLGWRPGQDEKAKISATSGGATRPAQDVPAAQFVEDIVEGLRQKPPSKEVCYVVLFGDRPLTATLEGGCILCFTQRSKAEEFMTKYQGIYYCTKPLSALPLGEVPELWAMLNNKAKDTDYEPPYGLIINFNYAGQPYHKYSTDDLKRIGLTGLQRGFGALPR